MQVVKNNSWKWRRISKDGFPKGRKEGELMHESGKKKTEIKGECIRGTDKIKDKE